MSQFHVKQIQECPQVSMKQNPRLLEMEPCEINYEEQAIRSEHLRMDLNRWLHPYNLYYKLTDQVQNACPKPLHLRQTKTRARTARCPRAPRWAASARPSDPHEGNANTAPSACPSCVPTSKPHSTRRPRKSARCARAADRPQTKSLFAADDRWQVVF